MPQANVKHWRRLDNAAKLFPAASSKRDTRVFRFYCELKEDIQQEILQKAVDRTLEKYPIFLSVLRKGLFWHYLEQSNKRPVVREEYKEPCSSLYIRDKRDLLFEVTYYKKRINFEVFHVLTDGTGASEFVRELVKNYLYLAHHEDGLEDVVLSEYSESLSDQEADGFERYYSRQADRKKEKKPAAHQLRGNRRELGSLQTTEAEIPVEELKRQAKTYGVSMTVFLTAVYLCAIHRTMTRRQESKPVVLMVPVNLRNFFPTNTMLNFFNWIEPGYHFQGGKEEFADVVQKVNACFKEDPVDPDQPSVDPSKPSTPEEKPGTSIEENKKDDKTSTTVAKDDKKTNKKESAKKANEQKSDTVQTGDHSNVFVYVATLLIAGAAAVVAFFRRRNA